MTSINDISAGLGDAFVKDKVSFEGGLRSIAEEGSLRRIQRLFEEIAETEELPLGTPLATEVEPEKPGSSS